MNSATLTTPAAALAAEAIRRRDEKYAEAITAAKLLAGGTLAIDADQWEEYATAAGTTIEGYAAIIDAFAALAPVWEEFARLPDLEQRRRNLQDSRSAKVATIEAEQATLRTRLAALDAAHRAASSEGEYEIANLGGEIDLVSARRKTLIERCADPALVRRRAEAIRRGAAADEKARPLIQERDIIASRMHKIPETATDYIAEARHKLHILALQIGSLNHDADQARDERQSVEQQMLTR